MPESSRSLSEPKRLTPYYLVAPSHPVSLLAFWFNPLKVELLAGDLSAAHINQPTSLFMGGVFRLKQVLPFLPSFEFNTTCQHTMPL